MSTLFYDESAANGNGKNVADIERLVSVVAGGAMLAGGITRKGLGGGAMAAAGAMLLHRGVTGRCMGYSAIRVSTAEEMPAPPVTVDRAVTVECSVEDAYSFWRDFSNFPKFMDHLERVDVLDESLSHWVSKAPAGQTVEWDAQLVEERLNELIRWRTLPGSQIRHEGEVWFEPATGGRGTVVFAIMNYWPPGGKLGRAFAKAFGEEPEQQMAADMRHFKQMMETGVVPQNQPQPTARPDDSLIKGFVKSAVEGAGK
jgi:uncharacterized membrane protein